MSPIDEVFPESQPEQREYTDSGNCVQITKVVGERVTSLQQLLKVCEVDGSEWEVERWTANKWEMGAMLRTQESARVPIITELYQVKAWFRRKLKVIAARDEIQAMLAELAGAAPKFPAIKRSKPDGIRVELSFPDIHVGKLAWPEETGHGAWDSKIAAATYRTAFERVQERVSHHKISRILLVFGNDALHADTKAGTTTKGTPLDCDGRQPKMFRVMRQLAVWSIEQASKIAPVDVLMVPGNHDEQAVFYLGEVLEAWFRNAKNVNIDNRPTLRKFYSFGKVALMFTHGDKGKRKNYPLLMATEAPEAWGKARYREIHTGDKHQERLEEQMGVRVRILPSLCPPDAWHAAEGYVNNIQSAQGFVWDPNEGLIATAHYNVQD
jgi:hypothetical protein